MISTQSRPGVGAIVGLVLIVAGSWLSTGGRLPVSAMQSRIGRSSRSSGDPT